MRRAEDAHDRGRASFDPSSAACVHALQVFLHHAVAATQQRRAVAVGLAGPEPVHHHGFARRQRQRGEVVAAIRRPKGGRPAGIVGRGQPGTEPVEHARMPVFICARCSRTKSNAARSRLLKSRPRRLSEKREHTHRTTITTRDKFSIPSNGPGLFVSS